MSVQYVGGPKFCEIFLLIQLAAETLNVSALSVWTASDICLIGEQGPSEASCPRESNDVAAATARRPRKWEDKKLHSVRSFRVTDTLKCEHRFFYGRM